MVLTIALHSNGAFGCAIDLPTRVLVTGDDGLLAPPDTVFSQELERLLQQVPNRLAGYGRDNYSAREFTTETDIHDFSGAANALEMERIKRQQLIKDYTEKRRVVSSCGFTEIPDDERKAYLVWAQDNFNYGPDMLRQYYGYLLGAMYYHLEETDSAFLTWRLLLMLPEPLRKDRSVWASYMLGRLLQADDPEKAWQWYEKARGQIAKGFGDSLSLAGNISGWQARKIWQSSKAAEAFTIYLQLGDKQSLQQLCLELTHARPGENSPPLAHYANAPLTRRLLTLYLAAKKSIVRREFAELWLAELKPDSEIEQEEAGEIALLSYSLGHFDTAQLWLAQAGNATLAKRLRVKLALRSGDIDQAIAGLATLIRECPAARRQEIAAQIPQDGEPAPTRSVGEILLGELGTLYLSRGLFVKALDSLYRGGYWGDAAYVAERVLTTDELVDYVKTFSSSSAADLRYLLARRLAREKRFNEAKAYFPASLQKAITIYRDDVVVGYDTSATPARRAKSLADGARFVRENGIGLLATEVEPDWYIYGCDYEMDKTPAERGGKETGAITAMSREEAARLEANGALHPDIRFHYRYVATDLAWDATRLMPDNTRELAQLLCEAGSWIKADTPNEADIFYKSLVRRAGKTPLGQAADKKRWFPDCDADAK